MSILAGIFNSNFYFINSELEYYSDISRIGQTLCSALENVKIKYSWVSGYRDLSIIFSQIAVLAEDAIKAALSDYRIKQQSKIKEKEATN